MALSRSAAAAGGCRTDLVRRRRDAVAARLLQLLVGVVRALPDVRADVVVLLVEIEVEAPMGNRPSNLTQLTATTSTSDNSEVPVVASSDCNETQQKEAKSNDFRQGSAKKKRDKTYRVEALSPEIQRLIESWPSLPEK